MANTTPILSWTNATGTAPVTTFDMGVVDAGTISNEFEFLLWNNRRVVGSVNPETSQEIGATNLSNVEDLTITTKDISGGTNSEVVRNTWIRLNVPDQDTQWKRLGFDTALNQDIRVPVGSTGSTTYTYDGEETPTVSTPNQGDHVSVNGTVSLLGVANDGTLDNSQGNFIRLKFRAEVPGVATAGIKEFLVRASYKYI